MLEEDADGFGVCEGEGEEAGGEIWRRRSGILFLVVSDA